jgi:hypothetical protein
MALASGSSLVALSHMARRALLFAGMLALTLALMLALAACERAKTPASGAPADAASSSPGGSATVSATRAWDGELGALFATPSLDGGTPVLFARDTAANADVEVELFNHDDHTSRAVLHPGTVIRSCAWRRNASLTLSDGAAAPNTWMLALSPGVATPYGIDGVAELLPRDSAATVARISRLVSAIPEDSNTAPFRGLPIVVREAWRFQLADSTVVAVAIAAQSLNVESNPRAQAITLIAEPDPSAGAGQWRTAFFERTAGPEDRVEGMDLLAAFQLRGSRPAIALVREGDAGLQIEIVERTAPGAWSVRWSSAALQCARP